LSLSSSCVALVKGARHRVISAQLVAVSTSGQTGLDQVVELTG
ncbi:MAG: hypothetical protein QOD66_24, partial [Solirubrobacteraceae bacterium]|nr:hypothetical protein [Solirubrobacteraceae bacterium]